MVVASQVFGDPLKILIVDGIGNLALNGGFKLMIGGVAHHAVHFPADEVQGKIIFAIAPDHADGQGVGKQGEEVFPVAMYQIPIAGDFFIAIMRNCLQRIPGGTHFLNGPMLLCHILEDADIQGSVALLFPPLFGSVLFVHPFVTTACNEILLHVTKNYRKN